MGSAILYLLEGGAVSRWHRVDAEELWVHAGGGPLELRTWAGEGHEVLTEVLGSSAAAQSLVPAGHWQQAATLDHWTLVTCVVVPEFLDTGFELAPEGWEPSTP